MIVQVRPDEVSLFRSVDNQTVLQVCGKEGGRIKAVISDVVLVGLEKQLTDLIDCLGLDREKLLKSVGLSTIYRGE